MAGDFSIWTFAYAHSELPADMFGGSPVFSNQGTLPIPMVYSLVRGIAGSEGPHNILIDTGFSSARSMTGNDYRECEAPDRILAKVGLTPADIDAVILTHMHFDHAGNVGAFPNARIHVQRMEYEGWKAVLARFDGNPPGKESWIMSSLNADDFEVFDRLIAAGQVNFLDGDAELFPGIACRLAADSHTFGSQWVEVATSNGPYIIAGDCVYWYANVERGWPPGYHQGNAWNLMATYEKIAAAVGGDTSRIVPGHDPEIFTRHPSWIDGKYESAEIHLAKSEPSRRF